MKKFLFTALVGASALAFSAGAFAEGKAAIDSNTQLNTDAAPSAADNSVAHGNIDVNTDTNTISATSTNGVHTSQGSATLNADGTIDAKAGKKDGDDEAGMSANGNANANAKASSDAAEDKAEVAQDMTTKTGVMKTRAKGAMGMLNPAEIKTVQSNLKQAGYNVSVDGVWGKHTRAALKEYQKSKNLTVSGKMDADTRASMGMNNDAATPENTATPDSNKY
jgi:hypothetical protein